MPLRRLSLVKVIVIGLTATSFCLAFYYLGKQHGEAKIQLAWNQDSEERKQVYDALNRAYLALEVEHRMTTDALTTELKTIREAHQAELIAIDSEYVSRLRNSEKRARVYKSQADGTAIERRALAHHAAQLDASLEEGRKVVRELGTTLRQRDRQLEILGSQMKSDRKLLEDNNGKRSSSSYFSGHKPEN